MINQTKTTVWITVSMLTSPFCTIHLLYSIAHSLNKHPIGDYNHFQSCQSSTIQLKAACDRRQFFVVVLIIFFSFSWTGGTWGKVSAHQCLIWTTSSWVGWKERLARVTSACCCETERKGDTEIEPKRELLCLGQNFFFSKYSVW